MFSPISVVRVVITTNNFRLILNLSLILHKIIKFHFFQHVFFNFTMSQRTKRASKQTARMAEYTSGLNASKSATKKQKQKQKIADLEARLAAAEVQPERPDTEPEDDRSTPYSEAEIVSNSPSPVLPSSKAPGDGEGYLNIHPESNSDLAKETEALEREVLLLKKTKLQNEAARLKQEIAKETSSTKVVQNGRETIQNLRTRHKETAKQQLKNARLDHLWRDDEYDEPQGELNNYSDVDSDRDSIYYEEDDLICAYPNKHVGKAHTREINFRDTPYKQ